MPAQLRLYRHQWEATGSGDAKSIQNAMGKTSLDLWSVLLREALQNSWDARLGNSIGFSIEEKLLPEAETSVVINDVFGELPPKGASTTLPSRLSGGRLRVLVISDYGTRGLGGPIRANFASAHEGEKRDFVDFVRNFGRSKSKGLEGGTYGLGKGVLYGASNVGMCLVYSQTRVGSEVENRLIGISGGDDDYDDKGLKYTGRNWWGSIAEDGIVDPLVGIDARMVAESVGMPVPKIDETGTCIMILDPTHFDGNGAIVHLQDRMDAIRGAAVMWAWPHAIDLGSGPAVAFNFHFEGQELAPIRPLEEPSIRHFAQGYVDVMRHIESGNDPQSAQSKLVPIRSSRPSKPLGTLLLRQAPNFVDDNKSLENTVALMRSPKMVVKYHPVAVPAGDFSVYSVFLAHKDVDRYFASCEPVAHDDWVVENAEKDGRRNYVRTAMSEIDETFKKLYSTTTTATASQRVAGAARISNALGGLISGFTGSGSSSRESTSADPISAVSRPTSTRRAKIKPAGSPRLLTHGDQVLVSFPYEIAGGQDGQSFKLVATAHVVLGTGAIESGDSGLPEETPTFVGWVSGDSQELQDSVIVTVPSESIYHAVFIQPTYTAVGSTAGLEMVPE